MNTGAIILAAGSSSRLGRPKQLVVFQQKTLIQKAIDAAQESVANSFVVVLGWNPELIQAGFDAAKVPFVINHSWESGMASSIQAGLQVLQEMGDLDQVLILLCDQPFVDADLLDRLAERSADSGKGIVASLYAGSLGVPALFSKKYFPELIRLKGQEGAKKLIQSHVEDVAEVDFPKGAIDLDTREDLRKLEAAESINPDHS